MLTGECHCGNIKYIYDVSPEYVTECNCSICRRLGALWAYADAEYINIICPGDSISEYSWGDKSLAFCSCKICGCTTHWRSLDSNNSSRMAVNMRLVDPENIKSLPIRHFDGADSFKYLD